mmetsp:Transcript_3686/g.14414  ORF Transcript_3686/g.14414 Transcript_3686/m.14414 type:complete len:257 (-) Transcript_3686:602-1372(-)
MPRETPRSRHIVPLSDAASDVSGDWQSSRSSARSRHHADPASTATAATPVAPSAFCARSNTSSPSSSSSSSDDDDRASACRRSLSTSDTSPATSSCGRSWHLRSLSTLSTPHGARPAASARAPLSPKALRDRSSAWSCADNVMPSSVAGMTPASARVSERTPASAAAGRSASLSASASSLQLTGGVPPVEGGLEEEEDDALSSIDWYDFDALSTAAIATRSNLDTFCVSSAHCERSSVVCDDWRARSVVGLGARRA